MIMNEDKMIIGVFQSEAELIAKINELTLNGYSEDDMYVITKDNDGISMLRRRTDVEVQSASRSWNDWFKAFLTGEDPVRENFRKIGLTDVESESYYREVENGGYLLYVDQEYNDGYKDHNLTANNLTGTEENQVVDIPVEREEGFVERRHVEDNKNVHAEDDVFEKRSRPFKDDETIRIPIKEERVEVTKKPVVSEEIVVGKRKTQDTETVQETVRREEAHIHEDNRARKEKEHLKK